jgi:hypothetical protein
MGGQVRIDRVGLEAFILQHGANRGVMGEASGAGKGMGAGQRQLVKLVVGCLRGAAQRAPPAGIEWIFPGQLVQVVVEKGTLVSKFELALVRQVTQ